MIALVGPDWTGLTLSGWKFPIIPNYFMSASMGRHHLRLEWSSEGEYTEYQ
jgi:hypothetical protein